MNKMAYNSRRKVAYIACTVCHNEANWECKWTHTTHGRCTKRGKKLSFLLNHYYYWLLLWYHLQYSTTIENFKIPFLCVCMHVHASICVICYTCQLNDIIGSYIRWRESFKLNKKYLSTVFTMQQSYTAAPIIHDRNNYLIRETHNHFL